MTAVLEGGAGDAKAAVRLGRTPRVLMTKAAGGEPLAVRVARRSGSRHPAAVRLLEALGQAPARRAFAQCAGMAEAVEGPARSAAGFARAVTDWWLPGCSLAVNAYNDPREVLGSPDAVNLGGKDNYLKIEDGEIYPCRSAGSVSEGSDLDAVEWLGA